MNREKELLLIPCSKTKLDNKAPAKELYIGLYFKACLDLAVRSNVKVKILSGKYGLIDPEDIIEPYNLGMKQQLEPYITDWALKVKKQLFSYKGNLVSIAGTSYELPLLRVGIPLDLRLSGRKNGERLKIVLSTETTSKLPTEIDMLRIEEILDMLRQKNSKKLQMLADG